MPPTAFPFVLPRVDGLNPTNYSIPVIQWVLLIERNVICELPPIYLYFSTVSFPFTLQISARSLSPLRD